MRRDEVMNFKRVDMDEALGGVMFEHDLSTVAFAATSNIKIMLIVALGLSLGLWAAIWFGIWALLTGGPI